MLPLVSNTKRTLIAGITAFAVLAAGASPAMAWGKNEQKFLAGVLATLAVGAIIQDSKRPHVQMPQRPYQPTYQPPYQPTYQPRPEYHQPTYYQPAPVSIYQTPVGQAFNTYTSNERRRIQSTLTAYGYYRGGIDGSFGPGTYGALDAYARSTGKTAQLASRAGSYGVLDALLF